MLTDPMSPMGASVFRFLVGCSEKYVTQVNGYLYVNIAVLLMLAPIRRIFVSKNCCYES